MKWTYYFFVVCLFFSCDKTDPGIEQDTLDQIPGHEKALFTTYWELQNTILESYPWGEGNNFMRFFEGTWQVLEVISINENEQILHFDYTGNFIEYTFTTDCKSTTSSQWLCRYETNYLVDPLGIYAVKSVDEKERLYVKSGNGSSEPTDPIFQSGWGDIYTWPNMPDIMVIHNPDAPFWIILQKVFTG